MTASPPDAAAPSPPEFPIVGIGASAGGLEASSALFGAMPAESGMAFILVQHLDPLQESHLAELLAGRTTMKVLEAEQNMRVEPNRLYIIPRNRTLTLRKGFLHLREPEEPRGHRRPIDVFFRSLAEECRERAVGIVLSGTGSNGTAGLRAIKAEGGLTVAQDPETARFDGMPFSAIRSGAIDHVLPPDKMPAILLKYAAHPSFKDDDDLETRRMEASHQLNAILALLSTRWGTEFREYKKPTLLRRIQRRMRIHHIEEIAVYAQFLRENSAEAEALNKDLTVSVTSFFREPEAWKDLEEKVVGPLMRAREAGSSIRAWVPACSTGEEAYSLAILLVEQAEAVQKKFEIKIFATDVVEDVLTAARRGVFPGSVAADLSPERLARFFHKEEEGDAYQINERIRSLIAFAPQNVLRDPPFSQLDIVSCRNLLIYLEPDAQRRLFSLLHFALRPDGHLFLGRSESIGREEQLFEPVSNKSKIFRRIRSSRHNLVDVPLAGRYPQGGSSPQTSQPRIKFSDLAHRVLAARYAPASVLVNRKFEILFFHGPTETYLAHPAGEPTRDLLAMVRPGLSPRLRIAVRNALREHRIVTVRGVRREGEDELRNVTLTVTPLDAEAEAEGLLLVSFEQEVQPESPVSASSQEANEIATEHQFEEELRRTREELRGTIEELESANEELESANEELKATNEEITSMNEELQSTNEELQVSKEELQSLNEELDTINAQLQQKVEDLDETNNHLNNLLTSTQIATLFLDPQLRVRWFTPAVERLLEIIPSDVGRRIEHFARKLTARDVARDATAVLEKLQSIENEVAGDEGRCYLRRVLPYRTTDNRIEGVVITFTDITERKRSENEAHRARAYAESVVDTVREPLVVLEADLRVRSANEAFYSTFAISPAEAKGRLIYELGSHEWDIPRLRMLLEQLLPEKKDLVDFEVEHEFESIGRRSMLLNARQLDGEPLILLAIEDVTERKRAESGLLRAKEDLEEAVRRRTHELEQRSLQLQALAAKLTRVEQHERRRMAHLLHDNLQQLLVAALARLSLAKTQWSEKDSGASLEPVGELLDQALAASRSLTAELSPPILYEGGLRAALHWLVEWYEQTSRFIVELEVDSDADRTHETARVFIFSAVRELLLNAIKHAGVNRARVAIHVEEKNRLRVTVSDTGKGFDPNQLIGKMELAGGFGLFSLREQLNLLGGRMELHSAPGEGTRITLVVPIDPQEEKRPIADPLAMAPSRPGVRSEPLPNAKSRTSDDSSVIRVLLVDDHEIVREGIALLLRACPDIELVAEAKDGQTAVELARELKPDVVLMDILMPGVNGIDATRIITAELPETRVIGLSMHDEKDMAAGIIEAGAQAYLSKGGPVQNLIAAIRGER